MKRQAQVGRLVVLIDRYLPILGGAQKNVHELGRDLTRRGWSITVLTRRLDRELAPFERLDGVTIRRLGYAPERLVSKLWCLVRFTWWLVRRRREYDLVLAVPCISITDLIPAYLASRVCNLRYLVRSTSTANFEDLLGRWGGVGIQSFVPRVLWRRVYRDAHRIIAQSPVIRDKAREYGIDPATVIVNAVNTERFRPAAAEDRRSLRMKLGLPADRTLAVHTARYVPQKGYLTFLRAARKVEQERLPGRLYVVLLGATEGGQMTKLERSIRAYATEHGLDGSVRMVNDVENVEDYLRAADVFVFPSRYPEGMPNSLLEAMACGLPVLASDLPQVRAMFPEDHGQFFDPTDVDALVEKLCQLIQVPEGWRAHGRAHAEHVAARHEQSAITEAYQRLLAECLATSPAEVEVRDPGQGDHVIEV